MSECLLCDHTHTHTHTHLTSFNSEITPAKIGALADVPSVIQRERERVRTMRTHTHTHHTHHTHSHMHTHTHTHTDKDRSPIQDHYQVMTDGSHIYL